MDQSKRRQAKSRVPPQAESGPDNSLNRQFILSTIESTYRRALSTGQLTENAEITRKIDQFLAPQKPPKSHSNESITSALIVQLSFSGALEVSVISNVHRTPLPHFGASEQAQQKILIFFRDPGTVGVAGQTVIRWVTDDEAVAHLRSLLVSSETLPNEEIFNLYKQLERFADRPQVLASLTPERGRFLEKLSDWSESLLEIDDEALEAEDGDNDKESGRDTDDSGEEEDDEEALEIEDIASLDPATGDLSRIARKVVTLKRREALLNQVLSHSGALFRDVPGLAEFRESLSQTAQMLSDEAGQLYVRWQSGASGSIGVDLHRPCIVIDAQTQLPRITFTVQLEQLAQSARRLREFGFTIPPSIEAVESHVSKYIGLVRHLRRVVRFYCTVAERILLPQRPLLIDKAKAFTSLLESNQGKLSWADGIEPLSSWIGQLKQFMDAFLKENAHLRGRHVAVLALVTPIIDVQLANWGVTIAKAKVLMEELEVQYQHRNTLSWRRHWDVQLYKILEYYFACLAIESKQSQNRDPGTRNGTRNGGMGTYPSQTKDLDRQQQQLLFLSDSGAALPSLLGISSPSTLTVELVFNSSGYPAFEPPFETLKASIFRQVNRFVRFPSTFHAFVDWSGDRKLNPGAGGVTSRRGSQAAEQALDSGIHLDSLEAGAGAGGAVPGPKRGLFHNIYYRNAGKFHLIYQKAIDAIEELAEIRGRFREWCALYLLIRKLKMEVYEGSDAASNSPSFFICRSLEQYQHNLKLIKDLLSLFHRTFTGTNEIVCTRSNYIVNILPLKMFIKWLLGEAESTLLRLFIDQTGREIENIERLCRQTNDRLAAKPASITDLIDLDKFITEALPKTRESLAVESVTLKEKLHFYKSWSAESGSTATAHSQLPKIEQTKVYLKEFETHCETAHDLLGRYRESLQVRTVEQVKGVTTEVNSFLRRWSELPEPVRRSPEVISDFQINASDLTERVGQLSKGCDYFNLPQPDAFKNLREVSGEIADLYSKFHVLYEFEQGLEPYLEMEWIVCRNKLPKVNAYITEWTEKTGEGERDALLRSHLEGWKATLAILELCRGDFYQASHWTQLLSLLQIDKTYEDLRLVDLSGKREALKAARSGILELNKRAFNDYSLRETLHELEQFALNGKFALTPYETKEGKTVSLIRDWTAAFNQISDCFLLVGTVKSIEATADGAVSAEYTQAYSEWEGKLVALEGLLQALNSVQRKWISLEPIYSGTGGPRPGTSSGRSSAQASFFNDLLFTKHSNDFQELMRSITQLHGCQLIRLLSIANLDGRLKAIEANFAVTQRKLRSFIEESRQRFPRFYFLADEDLLLILSGKVDLNQSALVKKLFVNTIGKLLYKRAGPGSTGPGSTGIPENTGSSSDLIIEAIESVQGEVIRLRRSVRTNNTSGPLGIEAWLKELDSEIRSTLEFSYQEHLSQLRSLYSSETLWAAVPSQLLSVFACIDFTEKVEDAIRKHSLADLKFEYERIVGKLTGSKVSEEEAFAELLLKATLEEAKFNLGSKGSPLLEQSHLESLVKLKVKQIVLDVIHFINVIESLSEAGVRDLNHWAWQSQLRFYPKTPPAEPTVGGVTRRPPTGPASGGTRGVEVRMGLATFDYTFEYLGCLGEGKLVHTELTNRCFLTLTQAMDLGLGGNPYGPAGTGKTESVKALGQTLGRQVLVFNCDEAIDVKSMTRILVGLIKCGSWGCFDEFNRLQLDVLSVLSSQIQELQNSIKTRSKTATLAEYGQVEINPNAAIFITLNPAGKEYGGRNRIPDNLKSLFLPVAMSRPDSAAIVRFLLLAEGFSDPTARALGLKIPVWFELAGGSMSSQRHYDWGLRAIKACLEAAGRRLHAYPSLVLVGQMEETEMRLVVDTLRQQIKSKLVEEDVPKFDVLLEAAFGSKFTQKSSRKASKAGIPQSDDAEMDHFYQAVLKAFKELNLVESEPQIGKIYQLYEQLQTRFGIVLIGPSGSGKTTTWKLLRKALELLEAPADSQQASVKITVTVINPKAVVPKSRLFGYIDEDTREWIDGLFSSKARAILRTADEAETGGKAGPVPGSARPRTAAAPSVVEPAISAPMVMNWLLFDGDIDPDWVEALNSVLDDNRVLTLPSGERIDFDPARTRILFETTSLLSASPATISRLGVVSIDASGDLISQVVECFSHVHNLPVESTATTVQTFLRTNAGNILSALSTTSTLLEHLAYAAGNGESETSALDRMTGSFSKGQETSRNRGNRRSSFSGDFEQQNQPQINKLIQTRTICRCVEMLRPLLSAHVCLIGPVCCGKTTLVTEYLLASSATAQLLSLDCTPSSDASSLTSALLGSSTIMSGVLRPTSGSTDRFTLFIRHYELLQFDKWSSNSLVALLVTLLRYGGFYHPESFEWLTLERFQLIVTVTEAKLLDARMLSSMHLLQLEKPTLEELNLVLNSKASEMSPKLSSWFPRKYTQLLDLILRSSNLSDPETLNPLKVGIDLLESLSHYEESLLDESAIDYELARTVRPYLSGNSDQFRVLPQTSAIYTSLSGSSNFSQIDPETFKSQILKWLRSYATENDLPLAAIEPLPQTIALIAELCSFLAEWGSLGEPGPRVRSLVLLRSRGSSRKTFSRVIAHAFGFDRLWCPNGITSERHLANELKALLAADEASSGADSGSGPSKLLLLLDEIHFSILPFLRDRLFTALYGSQTTLSSNLSVYLIFTSSRLSPTDRLIWLRQARLHRMEPLSELDYGKLTDCLVSGSLKDQKRFLEQCRPLLPLFYPVYSHFCTEPEAKSNLYLYTSFVRTFLEILSSKMAGLGSEGDRLRLGVGKLNTVASQVGALKEEALKQKAALDAKRAEADEAFQMIMGSMHASEDKKVELEEVQSKIGTETVALKERKAKIDEELASIEPILQIAKAAVGGIQASALAEIRSLRAPPDAIRDILEGVLRLMGIKDTSWVSMKTFLSRKGMNEILNFDCHRITPEILAKVEQLLENRRESFQPATAKRASVAAASLAEWVKANVDYTRVLLKIDPLEKELAKLESGLVRAQARLKTLSLQLEGVDTEVGALRTRMQAVTVEAAQIEINLASSTKTLTASEALVGDLSGEHRRWAGQLKSIDTDRSSTPSKCLLAAAYLTVASGEASVSRRRELLAEALRKYFSELPAGDAFSPVDFLAYESEEELFLKGGPVRQPLPLVADPTHKAVTFFEGNSFESTRLSAKDWPKVLELSIRFGRTLLVTNFQPENLDIRLIPLLLGTLYGSSDTRFWTFLGDRKIDYNPNFKLYFLADNLSQTSGTSSVTSLFRIINLSPSFGSISTQLLRGIIGIKRPELEVERAKVESQVASLKKQLKALEDQLLESLNSSTEERILENTQLIEKLKFLKKSSAEIEQSLVDSGKLKADLEAEQQQYEGVAQFAANLFFSLGGLARLSPMYYFGFQEFEGVFRRTLEKVSNSGTITNEAICYSIYRYISRALFAEHRRALWHYFLSAFSNDISERTITKGASETETISEFLLETLKMNRQSGPGQSGPGQDVCLIMTSPGSDPSTEIVSTISGVDGATLRMISMGSDVLTQVNGLLGQTGQTQMVGSRASGSRSTPSQVLCLANLHLVIGWLPQLAQLLTSGNPSPFALIILITESSDTFPTTLLERCTKFAYESVPGIRAHLRRLRTASDGLSPKTQPNSAIRPLSSTRTFEETSGSESLFSFLEVFHAIVTERRFYLPFGWTKNYEFSFNEFRFARHLLTKLLGRKFINNSGPPGPGRGSSTKDRQLLLYDYIAGLFKDVIYGGKVDLPIDETILGHLLTRCFDPEEKFQLDGKGAPLQENEFTLLGLPLNADSIRSKAADERLKGHLQVLAAAASGSQNPQDSKVTAPASVQTRFGLEYFAKLWKKILVKCKVSPSAPGERLFADDEDYLLSITEEANSSVDYLHAAEWTEFVRKFSKEQLHYGKKLLEQVDGDLKEPGEAPRGHRRSGQVEDRCKLNQIPDLWASLWPDGPETTQDYLITLARIFIKLNNQEASFAAQGASHGALHGKPAFDLTACFHPKLFLNALHQYAARQLDLTVDQLTLTCLWNEGTTGAGAGARRRSSVALMTPTGEDDESTVRMKLKLIGIDASTKLCTVPLLGIALEGALFVQDRLAPCTVDSPFLSLMPSVNVVFLQKVPKPQNSKTPPASNFSSLSSVRLPLYSNSRRETLLAGGLDVPCGQGSEAKWPEMGVALVLGSWPN